MFVSRELVDCKEVIGQFVHPSTTEKTPTQWAVIHHGTTGAHIIPARPQEADFGTTVLAYALASMQRALLGEVTSALRAVVMDFLEEDRLLYIRFYYDGKVSEQPIDYWYSCISETVADFGLYDYSLDAEVERLDAPKKIPVLRGRYAYLKREEPYPEVEGILTSCKKTVRSLLIKILKRKKTLMSSSEER